MPTDQVQWLEVSEELCAEERPFVAPWDTLPRRQWLLPLDHSCRREASLSPGTEVGGLGLDLQFKG